jgi:hypothetical protein
MVENDYDAILKSTERRILISARGHWLATNRFESLDRQFTFFSIMAGFLVSLLAVMPITYKEMFSSMRDEISLGIFVFGATASVLSTLQAIFRWGSRAQSHSQAATDYTNARRQLEILKLEKPRDAEALSDLLRDLSRLSDLTPTVPERIWSKATAQIKKEGTTKFQ